MTKGVLRRLNQTRTLWDMLPPKSAASGSEFARVVNLLIFHSARRTGNTATIFDDRAGDWHGLDAVEQHGQSLIGYQHKFYPTPLSDTHRAAVEESLKTTRESMRKRKLRLAKWVLVTPQDLVESATRKTGGDVSWFNSLRKRLRLPFEIEHWGHTKLQAFFLETPSIGLYYYPELFPDGVERRKSFQDLRTRYDKALSSQYRDIEFVGMSVYKEEAARTVPMENIYIPLTVIPNEADEDDPNVPRRNPLDCLTAGSRNVVLGDPGSGKTTLLRFLALVGHSRALQRRYRAKRDSRMPFLITLRRYGDELKKQDTLSILEYVRANIEADFSLPGIPPEFLEYYLESGQALLLFDGVDELPNSSFKKKVRDRIRSIGQTYPGNTVVVTSRIYGYEGACRFPEKEFSHHRLAKLRIGEIERFVVDWYQARLEKPRDREDHTRSLTSILRNEEHHAIFDLARNPLLLTIIVLVHRIDAVLPDERHVLYQKCTETLLNTWHTWKFSDLDTLHRAKVDRQNLQRMQAIAYWMQHEGGSTATDRQAVVPYRDLHQFLTKHISTETPPHSELAPEDIATAFLEFVQDRAGLLVEVGHRRFSFVHLTFQEYLTASHIKTLSELNGVTRAWKKEIADHASDPRWREVIRLLVAAYGSNASQKFLVDKLIGTGRVATDRSRLLAGLLLDGVAAAIVRRESVIHSLIRVAQDADGDGISPTMSAVKACESKCDPDHSLAKMSIRSLVKRARNAEVLTRLRLVCLGLGYSLGEAYDACGKGDDRECALLSVFLGEVPKSQDWQFLEEMIDETWREAHGLLQSYPGGNLLATVLQTHALAQGAPRAAKRSFETLLVSLGGDSRWWSPASCLFLCNLVATGEDLEEQFCSGLSRFIKTIQHREQARTLVLARPDATIVSRATALDHALGRARSREDSRVTMHHARRRLMELDRSVNLAIDLMAEKGDARAIWSQIVADSVFQTETINFFHGVFDLAPRAHWSEAMRARFFPLLSARSAILYPGWWDETKHALACGGHGEAETYAAAWQLVFDGLLYIYGHHNDPTASPCAELGELTKTMDAVPLRVAHCIRDLAYGVESRADDLANMVTSADPEYRALFASCFWSKPDVRGDRRQLGLRRLPVSAPKLGIRHVKPKGRAGKA